MVFRLESAWMVFASLISIPFTALTFCSTTNDQKYDLIFRIVASIYTMAIMYMNCYAFYHLKLSHFVHGWIHKPKAIDICSLKEYISSLGNEIPGIDEYKENLFAAKCRLKGILKAISDSFEDIGLFCIMLSGSAAERFNIPLSIRCRHGGARELKMVQENHALFTDFDFMIYNLFSEASFLKKTTKFYIKADDLPKGFVNIYDNDTELAISSIRIKEQIYDSIQQMAYKELVSFPQENIRGVFKDWNKDFV